MKRMIVATALLAGALTGGTAPFAKPAAAQAWTDGAALNGYGYPGTGYGGPGGARGGGIGGLGPGPGFVPYGSAPVGPAYGQGFGNGRGFGYGPPQSWDGISRLPGGAGPAPLVGTPFGGALSTPGYGPGYGIFGYPGFPGSAYAYREPPLGGQRSQGGQR